MADSKLDPNKSYGWAGKILRVNLTDRQHLRLESTDTL